MLGSVPCKTRFLFYFRWFVILFSLDLSRITFKSPFEVIWLGLWLTAVFSSDSVWAENGP